jgi:hypothetical protein
MRRDDELSIDRNNRSSMIGRKYRFLTFLVYDVIGSHQNLEGGFFRDLEQ